MKNLVPIGRFARLCRLSVKALRHYDEQGILRPALVDAASGYRYYALGQAPEAGRIRLLRELAVPLETIRALLADPDPVSRRERLAQHRSLLAMRLEEQRRGLDALDRLLEGGEPAYAVSVRRLEATRLLAIRGRVTADAMGPETGRAFAELHGHLAAVGREPSGPPLALYPELWSEEEEIEVVWCVPVSRPLSGAGRAGGMALPAVAAAALLHAGPYETIGAAYAALQAFLQERGHEPAGPPREVYLSGPGQAADPAAHRTEILWPIQD